MQYEEVFVFLMNKLETGLPAYMTYHNAHHTKSVITAAEYLAKAENVTGDDLILLKTAALFHDSGFLQHHNDHEELSCKIAKKILPDYDYSPDQVEKICAIILATKIPQNPADKLGEILCDADLFYLGGNQYESNADKLFTEYKKTGALKSKTEWQLKQLEFLSGHHYFTASAIREREPQKQVYQRDLKVKIESSLSHHQKTNPYDLIQDIVFMIAGVIFAGFALNGFLVPNHFFDGGITGISLLLHESYKYNLARVIILLNLPFIALSYFTINPRFAYWTFISVLLLGVCLSLFPNHAVTSDKLLVSIFGGVFLGIGIGLVMRAGAALDGIEVLALYTLKRTSFTISEIILGINILIFSIAAFKFGVESALYSILTYFAASRSIDYVVEGLQAFTGVTIISGKSEVIKFQLVNNFKRGITVYKGERGFLPDKYDVNQDCDIIFTVINRLEFRKLKKLVYDVDPLAFVFAHTIKEASGGILKRRHRH